MERKRYRVAQWGTGHTGLRSLRAVLDHPQYDLVGLRVYSDAKVGRDAGDIAGVDRTTNMSEVAARSIPSDGASLRQVADAIGCPLDDVTTSARSAVAKKATKILTTTIEAGSVGAWAMDVIGLRGGKPFLTFSRTMYVVRDLDPQWRLGDTGWHVDIAGDSPLDIDIRFAKENYDPISPGYNAHIAVNSVAGVCEAETGNPRDR